MTKEIWYQLADREGYSDRYVTWGIVKRVDGSGVTFTSGLGFGVPEDLIPHVKVGEFFGIESKGSWGIGSTICGWWDDPQRPLRSETDEEMAAKRQKWLDDMEQERAERLESNRADWQQREDALPDWLRARLDTFHERGGEGFAKGGWGYELAVCELAVLYEKHGYPEKVNGKTKYDDMPQEIRDYDQNHGCSGNQHDMACALVQQHQANQSLAGTVSALSPITGDAFYEKES